MRKGLLFASLAIASVLSLSNDTFAQRRGGGGGGGGGGRNSIGGIIGGLSGYGGYGGNYYGGGYGGNYYGGGYGRGGYGSSYYSPYRYGGYNYGYSPNYYNQGYSSQYYSSPNYYSTPGYTVDSPYAQSYVPSTTQSFYSGPTQTANLQRVSIRVLVPAPDAQVWVQNQLMPTPQGMERYFESQPVESGYNYTYTVKARWMEEGRDIERERQIAVEPGQTATVDFRNLVGEKIAAPAR